MGVEKLDWRPGRSGTDAEAFSGLDALGAGTGRPEESVYVHSLDAKKLMNGAISADRETKDKVGAHQLLQGAA